MKINFFIKAKKLSTCTAKSSQVTSRKKSARAIISEAKYRVMKKNNEHLLKSNEKFKKIISKMQSEPIKKHHIPQ